MSEKDLEQFSVDAQQTDDAAAAAPADEATTEALGEAIAEINGEAEAQQAEAKDADALEVGVIKPIQTGKAESKRA